MKFEIEFAQFTKVIVEAESREEAETIAAVMDGEDIAEYEQGIVEGNIRAYKEVIEYLEEIK